MCIMSILLFPTRSLIHKQQGYCQVLFTTISQHIKDCPIDVQKYLWTDILIAFVSVVTPDITSWCRKLGNTFRDIYPSMSAQCAWWHQKVPSFRRGTRVRKPKGHPCSATDKLCSTWQVSFPLSILVKWELESAGLEDLSVSLALTL